MMLVDFHCHSCYSYDCLTTRDSILRVARGRGLTGVAVTDHDTFAFHRNEVGNLFITAQEVRTEYGDIIGIFIKEEIRSRSAQNVVREIKQKGGLAVLPHPFRYRSVLRMPQYLLPHFDLIEVLNGRCTKQQNDLALQLGTRLGMPFIGGSDAHLSTEIGAVTVSLENVNVWDEERIKDALVNGAATINGKSVSELRNFANRILGIPIRRIGRWL